MNDTDKTKTNTAKIAVVTAVMTIITIEQLTMSQLLPTPQSYFNLFF